jgi:ribosomal protein S18 acetylase RimI-like enzyme
MISTLPADIRHSGFHIAERPLPALGRESGLSYEISRESDLIARIDLVAAEPATNSIVLRGIRVADGGRVDEAVEGLRLLCEALWSGGPVDRLVLLCHATDGVTRQALGLLGVIIEGVQRSVSVPTSSVPEDQAQFSILRDEWRQTLSGTTAVRIAPGDVHLRLARPEDLTGLYELERSAFGVGYDLGQLRQFLDLFEGLILIAEDGQGAALGYLLQAPTYPDPSTAWILSMGVRHDVQNQGIGKALLRAGIELLQKINVRSVLLSVDPNNLRGIRVYENAGFRRHGSVSNYFGLHQDRLTMILAVGESGGASPGGPG